MVRLQLYGLIALSFVLGVAGIYFSGVSRGQDNIKRRIDEKRLDNMRTAKDVEDEMHELGDTYLSHRASRWLRDDEDQR